MGEQRTAKTTRNEPKKESISRKKTSLIPSSLFFFGIEIGSEGDLLDNLDAPNGCIFPWIVN